MSLGQIKGWNDDRKLVDYTCYIVMRLRGLIERSCILKSNKVINYCG